ncbi:MAG: cytochrome-c peroxidase [Flavobacteriales bacterium]|nr:cytochrome-c peroxidase [Flavobacteriales bacterium]
MKRWVTLASLVLVAFLSRSCKKESPPEETDNDITVVSTPEVGTPYELKVPPGFPTLEIPADNPMTLEGVALGRKLFYDPILSGDSTQSCSSCHSQKFAFSDNGKQFSEGIDGKKGARNAPAIINAAWLPSLFWDGRAETVEDQALQPVPNPIEMHLDWLDAEKKLNASSDYKNLFRQAFGTRVITSDLVVKAIAQFERTIISANSKFDKVYENKEFFSDEELEGYTIFFTEKGDCFHCHGGRQLTDQQFHNNGLDSVFTDRGLMEVTGNATDLGRFKTPTLRNIAYTAPYMHDGRFATLEEVVDFYSEHVVPSATIDPLMKKVNQGGLHLTALEKEYLIAFLNSFSDPYFLINSAYGPP